MRYIAALLFALPLLACSGGSDDGSNTSNISNAGVDAGTDAGSVSEDTRPVRTTEGAVAYWSGRPDLQSETLDDSVGTNDLAFTDQVFWYDTEKSGVYLGEGAELSAEFSNNEFATREMTVDFWWSAAPRGSVRLLAVGDPTDPVLTLRLEGMRTLVLTAGAGDDVREVSTDIWDREREAPIHVSVAVSRDSTVRLFLFGTQVDGLILPDELVLPPDATITFGDAEDDGAQGTFHTGAIYGRLLDNAEIWENWMVGWSPSRGDEVATSPDRFVVFARQGLNRGGVRAVSSTRIEANEPDRNFGGSSSGSAGISRLVLAKVVVDPIPLDGTLVRGDVRAFVSSSPFSDARDLTVSTLLVPWNVDEATWNSRAAELAWSEPGASAAGDDYAEPVRRVSIEQRGPIALPIPSEEVFEWAMDPASNNGFRIGSTVTDDIELCMQGCRGPGSFMAALVGQRTSADTPGRRPDVQRPGPDDDGQFTIDSSSGLSEVYRNGLFVGFGTDGTFRDDSYRDSHAYRIYAYDLQYVRSLARDLEPL